MPETTYNLSFTFHELGLLKSCIWLKIVSVKPDLKRLRTEEKGQPYSAHMIQMRLTELKELGRQYKKVVIKMKAILRKGQKTNEIALKKQWVVAG
jgi:hypothetical protein